MPKQILSRTHEHQTEYIRDNHDESGRVYAKTTHFDAATLQKNKRARLERPLQTGNRLQVHDGAEIIYHFQIPDTRQWRRFKKRHPQVARDLVGRDQFAREKAAATLAQLHPQWVTTKPGRPSMY